ncbi:hypothetical protein GCM10011324_36250 [Allosediminivita pacifica]|nr:hypothetical protein GCM10011324_36250 [Allosediminivita pacifica]
MGKGAIPGAPEDDTLDELSRQYRIEYKNRAEFAVRCAIIFGSAYVLYSYTGWVAALAWMAGYAILHAAYFGYLRLAISGRLPRSLAIAASLYALLICAFVWMPIYLMQIDDPALHIPATVAILAFMLFMISRADTRLDVIALQVLVVAAAAASVALRVLSHLDEPALQLVILASEAGLVGYYMQTLLVARRNRLNAEAAMKASIQCQKMEAIGKLAGGVAHDFNNMLTVILGNLELHELADTRVEKMETLAAARAAAERARGTVEQLLTFARRADFDVREGDLRDFVRHSIQLGRPLVTTSITLDSEVALRPLPVMVDRSHLTTAILNLIINAKDAMGGAGRITISADLLDLDRPVIAADGGAHGPGTFARVTVRDTGPGIPEEIRHRVLEPFFTTKEVGAGTGLGLAMVSGFANQSGGFVQIENSDEGTDVSIVLPLAAAARGQEALEDASSLAPADGSNRSTA